MKDTVKKRGKRAALIILCSVLALILAAIIFVLAFGNSLLNRINRVDEDDPTLSQEELESILNATDSLDPDFEGPILNSSDAELPDQAVDSISNDNSIINILLVGQDRREGQGRQRSDAMILCTINISEKTLTMTSFLRDTWVRIPGYYDERLNVPYAIRGGGFKLLDETLEYNFGVSVDHNIEVDFSGFKNLIDMVGGVTVNLTASEANYLNNLYGDKWSLSKGENILNGTQALAYSRIRALDNDIVRSNRQRTVLTALISKAKTLNILELYQLVEEVLPLLTTDMTNTDILGYVADIVPILSELTIKSQRIPADNAYAFARIDGKSVLYMSPENLEKNRQILKETIGLN